MTGQGGGISTGEAADIRQRLTATGEFLRKVAIECKAHEEVCAERYQAIKDKFEDMDEQAKARNAAINGRLNILMALGSAGVVSAAFGWDKALQMLLKFFGMGL